VIFVTFNDAILDAFALLATVTSLTDKSGVYYITSMKKILLISVALMSIISISCDLNAGKQDAKNKAAIETPKGKHSYAVGVDMGRNIKQIDAELDISMILQGIKDQMDSTRPALMNDSELTVALQDLISEINKNRMARDSIKAAENLASQKAFLEKNKGEVGIITTQSGLQYIVIAGGAGELAKEGDTVSVHYTGSLQDGTEFDSSIKRNQPLSVILSEGRLIKGWIEMLRLMKKGQKVKAWVPSNLGYGERGSPPVIPGSSLLVFEMELLDIKPAKK